MKVQRCKGTQDLSPADMVRFRRVESAFRDACLKWGYGEVRTPTLEYLHLFTATGTLAPGMLHKVYSFLDWDGWSGERVVLRPDVTIPVARYYIDCLAEQEQAKLFYVANVFRFEETGQEARERWQCGAELIGGGSPAADVELIVLALDVLRALGTGDVELRLSHAGLTRGALAGIGLSAGEQARVLDRNGNALAEFPDGSNSNLAALLSMRGGSPAILKNLKTLLAPGMPGLVPSLDNFITIADLVQALGYTYRIDIEAGKGFEYYTGVIFQLFAAGEKIGSGGRYDALIPVLGGRNVPASGFALYIDRLMSLLPLKEKTQRESILIKTEPELIADGFRLASRLHQSGFIAEVGATGNSAGFRWLVDVRSEAPLFTATDRVRRKRYTAATGDEVAAIIGEQSAKSRAA